MRVKSAKEVAQERYMYITEIYETGVTSAAEISRRTSIPRRTVSRFINLWKARTPIEEIRPIGNPQKITPEIRSFMASEIAKSPHLSSRDIQKRLMAAKGIEVYQYLIVGFRSNC
jgi:hypothetical protein